MTCFPELTYAVYADGELPAAEARAVETHLAACFRCRQLVEALRAENRLLAETLEEPAAEAAPARPFLRPRDLVWAAPAVLLAAGGLEAALNALWEWEPPTGLGWLNPVDFGFQSNFLFASFFYVQEGGAMLLETIRNLGLLMLGLATVAAAVWWVRRRAAGVSALLAVVLALIAAAPGQAVVKPKPGPGGTVTIGPGETINDTLMAAGSAVEIDGTVNGDAFVFAERISIKGTIKGDLLCVARTAEIDGKVEGNVGCFAQWVTIRGQVTGSAYGFAQMISLESNGRAERDLTAYGATIDIRGNVGRHATVGGAQVTLASTARVGGDLTAEVHRAANLQIAKGAIVAGKTETRLPQPKPRQSRYARPSFYFWEVIWLAAAFLTGLLLRWAFPAFLAVPAQNGRGLLVSLGIGFLVLVAMPAALVIAGITVVGLPAALVGLEAYLAAMYLAKVFVAVLLGQTLMGARSFAVALLAGLAIIFVVVNLPYVGGVVGFLVLLAGLGVIALQIRRAWQRAPVVG